MSHVVLLFLKEPKAKKEPKAISKKKSDEDLDEDSDQNPLRIYIKSDCLLIIDP
jgi:hypothetical protein